MKTLALGLTYRLEGKTKRATKVSGVVGDPVDFLTGLRMSYPIPADPSGLTGLRELNVIQTLVNVYWVFVEGVPDIRAGDVVVVDGEEYVVRLPQPQQVPDVLNIGSYTRLAVEKGAA